MAAGFEIPLVPYGVEGFFVVIHVQMVSHNVGAVVFVNAGGFGAGVVEAFGEKVYATTGAGQVGHKGFHRFFCF